MTTVATIEPKTAANEIIGQVTPRRDRMTGRRWVIWTALLLGGLVMMFPVYWVLVTAISPGGLAQDNGFTLWPRRVNLHIFGQAVHEQPIWRWLANSVVIAVVSVLLSVFISVLAGYAFSKYRFRGRNFLFGLMLVTIMVPIQVIMVPAFVIISKLGLVNTPWAVILPSCGPLIAVLTILTFVWRWNDFVWPLVALQTPEKYTISVGLASLNGAYSHPWDQIMAITLISMIPVMIVFFVFQKQFVQGIASTGIK